MRMWQGPKREVRDNPDLESSGIDHMSLFSYLSRCVIPALCSALVSTDRTRIEHTINHHAQSSISMNITTHPRPFSKHIFFGRGIIPRYIGCLERTIGSKLFGSERKIGGITRCFIMSVEGY